MENSVHAMGVDAAHRQHQGKTSDFFNGNLDIISGTKQRQRGQAQQKINADQGGKWDPISTANGSELIPTGLHVLEGAVFNLGGELLLVDGDVKESRDASHLPWQIGLEVVEMHEEDVRLLAALPPGAHVVKQAPPWPPVGLPRKGVPSFTDPLVEQRSRREPFLVPVRKWWADEAGCVVQRAVPLRVRSLVVLTSSHIRQQPRTAKQNPFQLFGRTCFCER